MDIIENYLVSLPTFIVQTINQKCQLLNPWNRLDIFTSRNSLDHLSPSNLCFYFTIYLKSRDSGKSDKVAVEQVKLEIINDSGVHPKEEDMNMKGIYTRMYTIKKSISSFLVTSPFFSYLLQKRFPEIQSCHFEASCGPAQEIVNYTYLENRRLNNINIEGYKLSIELNTIPSTLVVDFVNDYRLCTEVKSLWPSLVLDGSRASKEDNNMEWDTIADHEGYRIVTQKEEPHNSKIEDGDCEDRQEPKENDVLAVEEKYISIPVRRGGDGKERFMSEAETEEKEEEKKEDVKQILEAIFMNARELRKLTEKISWSNETAHEVLLKEKMVYQSLKNV